MNEINNQIPAHLMESPAAAIKPKNTMGKDDFMKLLLTQLQHQDPMKPMDHQEFSAQLAQFSSLEQLSNIGTGIQNLQKGFGDEAKLQALGMIGRRIQASGNEVDLVEGASVTLNHSLPPDFKPTGANVYGPGGQLVREISVIGREGREVLWDGKNNEGVQMPSGKYSFRVHGVGPNGQTQEAGAGLSGLVTGLEMEGAKPVLVIQTNNGKSKIDLDKVRQVMVSEDSQPTRPMQPPKMTQPPTVIQAPQVGEEAQEVSDSGDVDAAWGDSRNGRLGDLIAEGPLGFRP